MRAADADHQGVGSLGLPARRAPIAVASVAAAGVYAAWMARGGVADLPTLWVENLGQLAAAAWAGVMCLRAARRPGEPHRRTFLWLSAACLSWAGGQAVWSYYELLAGRPSPFPSLADVGFLLAVPTMVVAVALYPAQRLDRAGRVRVLLDALTVGASLLGVSWATSLGAVYETGGGGWLATVLGLAYPVGDVVVVTIALAALSAGTFTLRSRLMLIVAGAVALAASDSTFALQTAVGDYEGGQLVGAGWVCGFLLIALAAVRPPTAAALAGGAARGRPTLLAVYLPYAALALAVATLATQAVTDEGLDRFLLIDGVAILVLVVARQLVALTQNTVLARQLSDAVRELEVREEELRRRALRDPLTGLANRALLDEQLRAAVAGPAGDGQVGVLYCDLDGFKLINDVMGHAVGDRVLVAVAERILRCTRVPDTVARIGGDEFAVLLPLVVGPEDALAVAERIVAALREPFTVLGSELIVHTSIGVVTSDPGTTDGESLLRAADAAMYEAKRNRRGGVATFNRTLGAAMHRRLEVASGLHRALESGRLRMHYQPIVDLATGDVVGLEALLRWQHPERGLLPPEDFITVAEETGMIVPIGRWALERACGQLRAVHAAGLTGLTMAVNVSVQQLRSPDAVADLLEVIARSGLPPAALCVEITESVLIDDDGECAAVLRELEGLGVTIAVDDFGTGYSSLGLLRRFPVHVLKIDRSFVADLGVAAEATAITTAILQLARALGLAVVAEGVEREQHRDALLALGCSQAQGFLWSPPLPPEELLAYLVPEALPPETRRQGPGAGRRTAPPGGGAEGDGGSGRRGQRPLPLGDGLPPGDPMPSSSSNASQAASVTR